MSRKPILVLNMDKILLQPHYHLLQDRYDVFAVEDANAPAVQLPDQSSFWERAFLAALTGICADPSCSSKESAVAYAKEIADLAVSTAPQRG